MATHGSYLHGHLPFATGAKLANPDLEVVAVGGDGDGLRYRRRPFSYAGRRNVDMAYIVMTNEVYGLAKGQASPTLGQGRANQVAPAPQHQ